MIKYKYLIIGGGMTGHSAATGIRSVDKDGSLSMFTEEPNLPYERPPLSKKLWTGKAFESIWCPVDDLCMDIHTAESITAIDRASKKITVKKGTEYGYEKLLLATGGTPRKLDTGEGLINYYRTVQDYLALRADTEKADDFAIIGGGFIGSEIAAALTMNKKKVSSIYMEDGITARNLPHDLAQYVTKYFHDKGVTNYPGSSIVRVEKKKDKTSLVFKNDQNVETELISQRVVAGLGIIPNTQLVSASGLKVENGIVVNEYLQTDDPNVFSAGDAANYFDPTLNVRRRVEHADNAYAMGLAAGINMAGEMKPWNYLPYFYSDLFELGYEAVGELDARLETFSDWIEPFKKGVVYYLKDGRIRGVLLWNVWEKVPAAREAIAMKGPFNSQNLKGLIK
jgi:3-phenylpropionate/trans-cinnamate dioxygenase ferredoxin reductase subunit